MNRGKEELGSGRSATQRHWLPSEIVRAENKPSHPNDPATEPTDTARRQSGQHGNTSHSADSWLPRFFPILPLASPIKDSNCE